MISYAAVDLKRKKSQILVIHCADPRFQGAYRKMVDMLGDYHDLMVLPGASKAVVDDKNVVENIKLLHSLHHFETVHILDHIECGAFGHVSDECRDHTACLKKAKAKIETALPGVHVVSHLLGQKQELTVEV